MGQLLAFLYRYRAFFIFLTLELLCLWMIVTNNNYQRVAYFNAASGVVGSINQTADGIRDYFTLKQVNKELAQENVRLKQLLLQRTGGTLDSIKGFDIDTDTTDSVQYKLMAAEIVDNSIRQTNNFFMINKGSSDGIRPEMGVINQNGIVGKIRSVSKNFSSGISVLNSKNPISAKHKGSGRMGTVQWDGDGRDPKRAKFLYITRDVKIGIGDTIVTSSFNAIYPKDLMIGTVASVQPDDNQRDLDIEVNLSVDFARLSYVFVIENIYKEQIDSLAQTNPTDINE